MGTGNFKIENRYDYCVVDLNDDQIYGDFNSQAEAEEFIEKDNNEHNLIIRIYDWKEKIWLD